MSCPLDREQLELLEKIVFTLDSQSLHHPDLKFFKEYIEKFGGKIPSFAKQKEYAAGGDSQIPPEPVISDLSDEESDTELDIDNEGVIQPDILEDNQVMGDPEKETSDEERDQSDEKRSAAMALFAEQKYDEAIKLYHEAIELNPSSSLLFAKRGQVYLKLNKPNACIKDCTKALELNCDSAAGYKFRGRAHRLLGNWEEAAQDLRESCKIDFDEQANDWLTEVTPNADKLRAYKLNIQRKKEEKVHRDRLRRAKKAQAAHSTAAKESEKDQSDEPGFPGAQHNPNKDYANLFMDPDILSAMQDPDVAAAFQNISSNPANIMKYANNPKVAAIIQKLQSKLGGKGPGGMFGFPGSFPGFGGGPGTGPASAPKPPASGSDDVGLD